MRLCESKTSITQMYAMGEKMLQEVKENETDLNCDTNQRSIQIQGDFVCQVVS